MGGTWIRLLPLIGLIAATWWVYAAGVGGPWIFDDFPNLEILLQQRDLGWQGLIEHYLISPSGPLGRPVSMLSFIGSAIVSGDDLTQWKQFNVALHLLTGLCFFWLARLLFEDLGGWQRPVARNAALLVAGLWLLHPLHVSTVLYTVQRMTILPALFCAMGLALYLQGRRQLLLGQAAGWWSVLLALGLCWPLAALSKENGALLGLYILLLEALLPGLPSSGHGRRLQWLLVGAVLLPTVLGLLHFMPSLTGASFQLRDFSMAERVLTESRVVWGYVLWVFIPLQRFMGFMHDDVEISASWVEPPTTAIALLAWLTLVVVLWVLRRRTPLIVFGVGLFLLSHLIESTLFPLELVFEHRNYFGAYGLILALIALLSMGLSSSFLRLGLGVTALVLLGSLTLQRAQTWSDIHSLYLQMWRVHPHSPRLITTFAAQFARNGQHEQALAALKLSRDPRTDIATLYVYCLRDGTLPNELLAQIYPEPPKRLPDYFLSALVEVSLQGLDGHCHYDERAYVALLDRVVTPQNVKRLERYKLLIYRAQHLHRLGDLPAALASLDKAASLHPPSYVPLSLRTQWLAEAGHMQAARDSYARLASLVADGDADFTARMQELALMLE